MKKAVLNVNQEIASALKGQNPTNQKEIDEKMLDLDGFPPLFTLKKGSGRVTCSPPMYS